VQMADAEGRRGRGGSDKQDKKRQKYKSDSDYILRKRLPPRLPRRNNDIYITNKSNHQVCICRIHPIIEDLRIFTMTNHVFHVQGQLSRCEKLLNDGESDIVIHGLGAAVPRAVNLALQLKAKHLGTVEVAVNTSTVDVVG
jgi:ribonuclease P/MRP protein subunit RPP20